MHKSIILTSLLSYNISFSLLFRTFFNRSSTSTRYFIPLKLFTISFRSSCIFILYTFSRASTGHISVRPFRSKSRSILRSFIGIGARKRFMSEKRFAFVIRQFLASSIRVRKLLINWYSGLLL